MNLLSAMLSKEESRNENLIDMYTLELETLPKGSIKLKRVRDKNYFYLVFREGDKVITKYIGKDEQIIEPVREQLKRRKQVEQLLKKLKEERAKIKKLEAIL